MIPIAGTYQGKTKFLLKPWSGQRSSLAFQKSIRYPVGFWWWGKLNWEATCHWAKLMLSRKQHARLCREQANFRPRHQQSWNWPTTIRKDIKNYRAQSGRMATFGCRIILPVGSCYKSNAPTTIPNMFFCSCWASKIQKLMFKTNFPPGRNLKHDCTIFTFCIRSKIPAMLDAKGFLLHWISAGFLAIHVGRLRVSQNLVPATAPNVGVWQPSCGSNMESSGAGGSWLVSELWVQLSNLLI